MTSRADALNFYDLITKERAEKFTLLGQLILNQRESIILCGAEGIGKTTLLKTFKKHREAIWIICLQEGLATLSFEQIQTQLIATIQSYNPELADHDLESSLNFCEQQQKKAVLMIDDAVNLPNGLITQLTEYALHHPVLRIVFVFNREQLYMKSRTDSVVDDCYFMELPPLTKPQLLVFLEDLLTFPDTDNKVWQVNEPLLNKLYQRTQGIPGKIKTEFSLLVASEQQKTSLPLLKIALIVGIITITTSYFWIGKMEHKPKLAPKPVVTKSIPLKTVKLAVTKNTPATVKPNNTVITVVSPPPLIAEKTTAPPINNPVIQQDADEQWILQQTTGSYSLQLMALAKRQPLEKLVKKHSNLDPSLKVLKISSHNRENYVLLYGSFTNSKAAMAAVSSLPIEFRQAWPRQIKTLQQEIKKRTTPLPPSTPLPLKQ